MNLYKISDKRKGICYGEGKGNTKREALVKFLKNATFSCGIFNDKLVFHDLMGQTKFPNGETDFLVELIEAVE